MYLEMLITFKRKGGKHYANVGNIPIGSVFLMWRENGNYDAELQTYMFYLEMPIRLYTLNFLLYLIEH